VAANETIVARRKVAAGSDRQFGLVFAVVFAIIAIWPLPFGGSVRGWAAIIAAVFLGVALFSPRLLSPLNRVWHYFGLALHHIINPLLMGIIYCLAVVPTALVLKVCGKDLLRLKLEPDARSYWVVREPPGPPPSTMSRQY
jgi:predicted membrane metal-binding protein